VQIERKVLTVNRNLLSLSLAAVLIVSGIGFAQNQRHDRYSFACNSRNFMPENFAKQPVVRSPNGKNSVQLTRDYKFRITASGKKIAEFALPEAEINFEVDWSPDSSQFFISYSDSASYGGYHVHLYRVFENEVTENKLPELVAADFKAKHWCEARGNNLFFLNWTPDSSRAFLVAEVFPTGDCGKETGLYRGYLVNVSDAKILRVFGVKDTAAMEKNCRTSGKLVLPPARVIGENVWSAA